MYIFAYICLLFALLCAIGGGCLALLQLAQGRDDHLKLTGNLQIAIFSALTVASAILLHALYWKDYRLEYAASYTDSLLPVFYRLTAFWAGQQGSLLFWALASALASLLFRLFTSRRILRADVLLWFWTFNYSIMAFFCLALTCWSNPFVMLSPAPADGGGLNPLLQNPGMIFHPPLLFLGYAFFTAPACLALAQNAARDGEISWHRATGAYLIVSWLFLSAGIILGAWWAYMELGWGGYWAWDPVENASLLPWLLSSAALHILVVTRTSGKLKRSAALLTSLTVVSAFVAAYLTRSGVIQSVHAFGDGGVGTPLLVFITVALVVSVWVCFSAPGDGGGLASPFSREGLLTIASWIFIALALIILIATIWPVLRQILNLPPKGLDASFYNRVCLPLAAALLFILCACAWLKPLGGFVESRGLARFALTLGAAVATIAALWVADYRKPLALLSAGAAFGVLCAMAMKIFDKTVWKTRPGFTAFWAHIGMALMALGVAFSGPYSIDKEIFLSRGQSEPVGPYLVALEKIEEGAGPGYDFLRARLKATFDNQTAGVLTPERRIYAKYGSMQFSEASVVSSLGEDLYASLLGMDEDFRVLVKISVQPLVNWIWIGAVLLCVAPLFGFFICRRERN